MNSHRIAFIILCICLTFCNCKKYPDGPFLSLRSPEKRLIGGWAISKITLNGEDMLANNQCSYSTEKYNINFFDYEQVSLNFYFIQNNYFPKSLFYANLSRAVIGSYEFTERNNALELSFVDTSGTIHKYDWKILRLKKHICDRLLAISTLKKEFYAMDKRGNDEWIFEFRELYKESCR